MDWHIVYAKFDGCKGFKAFDVNEGRQVGNLIYASLMENTEDTRQKLQKLADLNKEYHLVLQLRRKGRVCFQTDPWFRLLLPDMVRPGRREGNRRLPARFEMETRGHGL